MTDWYEKCIEEEEVNENVTCMEMDEEKENDPRGKIEVPATCQKNLLRHQINMHNEPHICILIYVIENKCFNKVFRSKCSFMDGD